MPDKEMSTSTRRRFLQTFSWAAASALVPGPRAAAAEQPRPNILWLTCEDMSPDLGCYGDEYARSPNIDRLASQGLRYESCFSISGVCAPSRSAIITGMYPTTIGTMHMRTKAVPPPEVKCFPEYLRAAGYYCTNNVKTDYQFDAPVTAWDESSRQAHWRNRPKGQPFFSVINFTVTHESRIRSAPERFAEDTRRLKPPDRHDPAQARVPPYYPDAPIVRRDWANYHDLITAMDLLVGDELQKLDEDELAENTIVFFYSDHGRGLPRAKRWIYDSGIHVPLIVRWPDVLESGTVTNELASFVDFGPTVLSLAGVEIPSHMQGQALLGEQKAAPRDYVFAGRDRMDEAYDLIRAVRDKRYKYLRNYRPETTRGQHINYMDQMPTMKEMRRLHAEGKLQGPEMQYFELAKPVEELYDTETDPHEVVNLADSPEHQETLLRMRQAHERWRKDTHDLGLIPEAEAMERMRPGAKWETTAAPTIEPPGGRLAGVQEVKLSCDTVGASIAYTTEAGGQPHWQLYHGPITLKRSGTVRAKAIRLGYRESSETTAKFRVG